MLGSIVNDTNSIEEEFQERIALGIKAYYANLKFFKSRLVTKDSKLQLYRTVIRPVTTGLITVLYNCNFESETWVLKENIIQKLLVFDKKILRGIFGPTKKNQTWRIKNNEELDKLIKHENIVNYIKAQRLRWFGHIQGAAFNVTHFESRITHLLYAAINTTEHGQVSKRLGFTKSLTSLIQSLGDVLHDNQGIAAISQVHLP